MSKTTIKKAYQPHARVQYINHDPSLTEQSHKKRCDTTHIVTQYLKTGVTDHMNVHSEINSYEVHNLDFKTAQDMVASGNSAFAELPFKIRKQFDHSPAQFVEFAQNPKNLDKMRDLGLANPLPPVDIQPALNPSKETIDPPPAKEK